MAKDFRTGTARIHRGLNRLEKVLLETRRAGASVSRSLSAVLARDGHPEFHGQRSVAGWRDKRGKPGARFPDSHAQTETGHGRPAARHPFRRLRHANSTTFRQKAANAANAPASPKKIQSDCRRQTDLFPAATFTGENAAPPALRHGGESSGNIRTFGDGYKGTVEQKTIIMAK